MNGPHAPFERLRVNGWEEFKKEYVYSIMDPLVNQFFLTMTSLREALKRPEKAFMAIARMMGASF
jgi:hypothetical protein